ncbi:MAG: hypothetical protein P8J17_06180 [Halioglobus sp.]|nr:hypothetical protein [Halioglobus sp.]
MTTEIAGNDTCFSVNIVINNSGFRIELGLFILAIMHAVLTVLLTSTMCADEYISNYSANKHNANATSNAYGNGSPYRSDSRNNPYGEGLEMHGE